jgi:hypothetical protein
LSNDVCFFPFIKQGEPKTKETALKGTLSYIGKVVVNKELPD